MDSTDFEVISEITEVEKIAVGSGIRILPILRKRFGKGNWRKLKGVATVRLNDGTIRLNRRRTTLRQIENGQDLQD